MKVHQGTDSLPSIHNAVVTIGTFDGVHLGHQQILEQITSIARNCEGQSVLVTFDPHPRTVLQPQADIRMLTTLEEKIVLLEKHGIDHLIIVPFSRRFSEMPARDYVNTFLIDKLQAKVIVIGYDHRFGRNRKGDIRLLKDIAGAKGVELREIPAHTIDHSAISSTIIRKALQNGKVNDAADRLGRFYSLSGLVVKGEQMGRKLGYPTANIQVESALKLIPTDGIYTVLVSYKQQLFGGMLSIGMRPTFDGTNRTIEVNIFNFDKSIYGERLEVRFIRYLRSELNFADARALVKAMDKDKTESLQILASLGNAPG